MSGNAVRPGERGGPILEEPSHNGTAQAGISNVHANLLASRGFPAVYAEPTVDAATGFTL